MGVVLVGVVCLVIVCISNISKRREVKEIQKAHDADPNNSIKTNDWYRNNK